MPYVRRTTSGKWRAEYRDAAGRRHGRSFATKTAGRLWAADAEERVRVGTHLDPKAGRLTVRAWSAQWWAARVAEASTLATDRGRIDRHVLPAFGDKALADVSALDVQTWVKRLERDGLAPATVRSCHQLLAAMLKAAIGDERLLRNPCEATRLPTVPAGREVFLTREQVDAIAGKLRDRDARYAVLVVFLAYTGLRWGEAVGLQRRHLDLDAGEVHVRGTLEEVAGKKTPKPYGKTRAAFRTVGLPSHVVAELETHLEANPCRPGDLVFRGPRGAALSRVHFNLRTWRPALKAAELAHLEARPHDLRHTCASWLVQAGLSLFEVQAQLGHEGPAMAQRYAHLAPNRHDRVKAALERVDAGVTQAS